MLLCLVRPQETWEQSKLNVLTFSFTIVRKLPWTPVLEVAKVLLLGFCTCIKFLVPIFEIADRAAVDLALLLILVLENDVGLPGTRDYIDTLYSNVSFLMIFSTLGTPLTYVHHHCIGTHDSIQINMC